MDGQLHGNLKSFLCSPNPSEPDYQSTPLPGNYSSTMFSSIAIGVKQYRQYPSASFENGAASRCGMTDGLGYGGRERLIALPAQDTNPEKF